MSYSMSSVSDIKLIRTDTTLDLSQKAEKRYRLVVAIEHLDMCWAKRVGDGRVWACLIFDCQTLRETAGLNACWEF